MIEENVVNTHRDVLFSPEEEQNYVVLRKWVDTEIIMWHKISQTQKYTQHMLFTEERIYRKEKGSVGWRGDEGKGECEQNTSYSHA